MLERPLFWQWNRWHPYEHTNAAARDGRWKLVRPPLPGTLETDPAEQALDSAYRDAPWSTPEVIRGPVPPSPSQAHPIPPAQLFDLKDDPWEDQDRATERPEVVAALQRRLSAWFARAEADRSRIHIWPRQLER